MQSSSQTLKWFGWAAEVNKPFWPLLGFDLFAATVTDDLILDPREVLFTCRMRTRSRGESLRFV
jgi:hypothetical protein